MPICGGKSNIKKFRDNGRTQATAEIPSPVQIQIDRPIWGQEKDGEYGKKWGRLYL